MLKKLRIKFVCVVMTLVTLLLCVIFGLVIHFTNRSMEMETEALLQMASEPVFPGKPGPENTGLPFFTIQQDFFGNLQVTGNISAERYTKEQLQQFWDIASRSEGKNGQIADFHLKYRRESGPLARCVFVDISAQQMVLRSLAKICCGVGALSFLVLLGLSIGLAHWMVKPVDAAWKQQRQFVADASHELKTPLTVIMTNAELLQNPACTDQEQKQFSRSILTMSQQMRSLVEGLLELARVDNGSVQTSFADMNLSSLATQEVMTFEALFFERDLMLMSDIRPDVHVRGSEQHLRQVVQILLDNAMKYSVSGSEVWLRLVRQGGSCILSVASRGKPISQVELKNIFQRFYRVDKARSGDGSYGLGLSIAQRIVQEHRGRIWAQSDNGTNVFFVQLSAN